MRVVPLRSVDDAAVDHFVRQRINVDAQLVTENFGGATAGVNHQRLTLPGLVWHPNGVERIQVWVQTNELANVSEVLRQFIFRECFQIVSDYQLTHSTSVLEPRLPHLGVFVKC